MVLTRSAAKGLALKEAGLKEKQKKDALVNEAVSDSQSSSMRRHGNSSTQSDKKLKSDDRTGNRRKNCSSKKMQPPSRRPTSKQAKDPLPARKKCRPVKDDSMDVESKLMFVRPKAIRKVPRMSTTKGYCAKRYKVLRGTSVPKIEPTKPDPKENFLCTLPNRVKVVLPCGVIKSIAEKLREVEDDTALVEIFLFAADVQQITTTPSEAILIRRPQRKAMENSAISSVQDAHLDHSESLRSSRRSTNSGQSASLEIAAA